MNNKIKPAAFLKRRSIILLFAVSVLLTACKKTIINNYLDQQNSTPNSGLVLTPDNIYASIPAASLPVSGGGPLPGSFFLEIPSTPFNQGNQGSCASCASAMAKSVLDHVKNNTPYLNNGITYSPAYLYHQVNLNPNDCVHGGSTIDANLDILRDQGICKLSDMPYNDNDCTTAPTSNQLTLAMDHKIDHKFRLDPINESTIKQFIYAGLPVIVAFRVDDNYNNYYMNPANMNTVWSGIGTFTSSYHANLLYGWDDNKNAFKMLNQWGPQFGNNGSIWVSYNMVANHSVFVQAYIIQNPAASNTGNLQVSGDLNFGSVSVNTSTTKIIQLTNSGTTSINVSGVSVTSPFSTNWSSGTIAAGATKNVTITFNPTSLGNASATLTINSNATNNAVTIQATGTAVQQTTQTRVISLSGNLSFGDVNVGQSSGKTLTISNNGNSPLTISSISASQGFSANWSGVIQAGNSISTTVYFQPLNAQTYNSNIVVNSDATSGANTINANGNGLQQTTATRIISLTGNLSFGNVLVGQSTTRTLTISNMGNSPLTVNSLLTPAGFFSNNYSGIIQAGGSVNVTISFYPSNVQYYSGNIVVSSDATSGTGIKTVDGNGISNIPITNPPLGMYGNCAGSGNYTCPPSSTTYGAGVINARVVSINTSTHQIVVEIKKCSGTAFNAGGNFNVVSGLCTGVSYGFGSFQAGFNAVQMTITDNSMSGTKVYYPFIVQGTSLNILYAAPPLSITY